MNASFVLVFFMAVFMAFASAFPALDDGKLDVLEETKQQSLESLYQDELNENEEKGLRFRRVTCDLLSVSVPWGSLNHSACAAHCLAMGKGFRGGRCRDGVCHCRK